MNYLPFVGNKKLECIFKEPCTKVILFNLAPRNRWLAFRKSGIGAFERQHRIEARVVRQMKMKSMRRTLQNQPGQPNWYNYIHTHPTYGLQNKLIRGVFILSVCYVESTWQLHYQYQTEERRNKRFNRLCLLG